MKKTIYLLAAVAIYLLQSCSKSPDHPGYPSFDDQLLLSKVTGSNTKAPGYSFTISWNRFEFTRPAGADSFIYYAAYDYENSHSHLSPFKSESFGNGGKWDFTYKGFLPSTVIDNSTPGLDQGYWKFYYNNKHQIIKTGLAFKNAEEPTEFEFYGYDDYGNLTDLWFGNYVDTPRWKQTYKYDLAGNLTEWELLFPTGYKNANALAGAKVFASLANSMTGKKNINPQLALMMKKVSTGAYEFNRSGKGLAKPKASHLFGDSNVIYQNYITGQITTDGRYNPYYQRGDILFYITSRYYSADISTSYAQLSRSNILSVSNKMNPDFGDLPAMVSSYSYVYNRKGYPVTSQEVTADPGGIWFGANIGYVQNRAYEYISCH